MKRLPLLAVLLLCKLVPQLSDLRAGCLVKQLLCAFALLHEAGHVVRLLFFLFGVGEPLPHGSGGDPGLPCDTGGGCARFFTEDEHLLALLWGVRCSAHGDGFLAD